MRTLIFTLVAFSLLSGCACDAIAADPVSEFEKTVRANSESTERATPVYFNQYRNQWAKRKFSLLESKYDVKRTDSLVNPIVGVVAFTLVVQQSALVATREEAEQADDFSATKSTFKVLLTYAYKDDRWVFKDGEYVDPPLGAQRLPISRDKVAARPDSIPEVALKYWLP